MLNEIAGASATHASAQVAIKIPLSINT